MFLSVFDICKIGIGPSSSHTMGPMVAAARFLRALSERTFPAPVARLKVRLHGSLAYTGLGHASDRAILLGLAGHSPETLDLDRMDELVARIRATRILHGPGHPPYAFDPAADLVFDRETPLPGHANAMAFEALSADGTVLFRKAYFSVGGGFVLDEAELAETPAEAPGKGVPFAFGTAAEMLKAAGESGLSVAAMMRANELVFMSPETLERRLDRLWQTMFASVERGLRQDGVLPGGLAVRRRAPALHRRLQEDSLRNAGNPFAANDWLSVYAMAVNEENASGGRVVTAPTNGAGGVIPAVLCYLRHFHDGVGAGEFRTFLLTAAAIGGIIKRNASISGAEVGCQGEVGSASAMAAAGLAAVLGGSAPQIEHAAEIALEHHLGMTCDPVSGLVQIPCIERNAFGAVKAATAASLALKSDGRHLVTLDACIRTMRQTGLDMSEKYKETSLGGLAVSFPEC